MDAAKDLIIRRKHSLSFSEAEQLFAGNQDYLEIFDVRHSDDEDRFIAIDEIGRGIAVVVYTERDEERIRIVGARFATKGEQARYHAYMDQNG